MITDSGGDELLKKALFEWGFKNGREGNLYALKFAFPGGTAHYSSYEVMFDDKVAVIQPLPHVVGNLPKVVRIQFIFRFDAGGAVNRRLNENSVYHIGPVTEYDWLIGVFGEEVFPEYRLYIKSHQSGYRR